MSSLRSMAPDSACQTDVGRGAVACEPDDRAVLGLLALRAQPCLDAREHAGRGGERRDHGVVGEAQLWEVEPDRAHAAGRQGTHGVRSQHLEARAHHQRGAAAGARLVAEEVLVVGNGLGIEGHVSSPPSRCGRHPRRDPLAKRQMRRRRGCRRCPGTIRGGLRPLPKRSEQACERWPQPVQA